MDLSYIGRTYFNPYYKRLNAFETFTAALLTSTAVALAPEILTSFAICTTIKISSKILISELAANKIISNDTASYLEPLGNQFCTFYVENLFSSKQAIDILPKYALKTLGMMTGLAHLNIMNKFFYDKKGSVGSVFCFTALEEIFKNSSPHKILDLPFSILGGVCKNLIKKLLEQNTESFKLTFYKALNKSTIFYGSMQLIAERGNIIFENKFPRVILAVGISDILTPKIEERINEKLALKNKQNALQNWHK